MIEKMIPMPKKPKQAHSLKQWDSIERTINFKLPLSYKKFVNLYGGGGINSFLWILSPFVSNENLNLLKKKEEMKQAYDYMQSSEPNSFEYKFYDGKEGIFPWGITDNGDELYWNITDREITILVYEGRYIQGYEYSLDFEEFLCGLLDNKIICEAFPDDWLEQETYFEEIE